MKGGKSKGWRKNKRERTGNGNGDGNVEEMIFSLME